jgi:O-antigen ligase
MAAGSNLNFDHTWLAQIADGLAVAVAVSLPWSTSATAILIVLWLLALIPTLDWNDVRRELVTPAGGLPVLLVLLGALGILWADVTLLERWKGLDSFFKLLAIPLLLVQFRCSERGLWVFGGYLLSCTVLWAVSTIVFVFPALPLLKLQYDNVLVKNAATQSGEFVTCIFGLLFLAVESFNLRRWLLLFGLLAVALGMSASIFYVAIGRTSLVIIPVLLVLFAVKKLNAGGIAILFAGAILIGITGWLSSPYLRSRTIDLWTEIKMYEATDEVNSSGERIEFWKKSAAFVRAEPVIGHGTGSIESLFVSSSAGQSGTAGRVTTNPHNQTFAVAIQLGLIGAALLWAMWIAHFFLFRGSGLAEWIGLVVVIQNIVGSLFNSHLFDFTQGWVYAFGVGVAGGMAIKHRAQAAVGMSARSS